MDYDFVNPKPIKIEDLEILASKYALSRSDTAQTIIWGGQGHEMRCVHVCYGRTSQSIYTIQTSRANDHRSNPRVRQLVIDYYEFARPDEVSIGTGEPKLKFPTLEELFAYTSITRPELVRIGQQ